MRLKHFDYTRLVIEAYKKKRQNNELSPLLSQSTPGNIRRECANVYQERFEKKDEQMLRAFFGPAEQGRRFLAAIQEFDVNKFKPLDKYLKGGGKNPISDRNLELLAWLIDFQHRPYLFDNYVNLSDEELSFINESALDAGEMQTESAPGENGLNKKEEGSESLEHGTGKIPASEKNEKESPILSNGFIKNDTAKSRYKRAVIIFLILAICSGGVYIIWQQNRDTVCGYWAGDHYQEVPCSEDPRGRIILSISKERMQGFRKITQKDTITEWSVGKAYYIKNDDTIECYTEGGNYPLDLTRNLKLLSRRIFDKYLHKKEGYGKDSLAKK